MIEEMALPVEATIVASVATEVRALLLVGLLPETVCFLGLTLTEDEDYDRRPQRRRYDEPLHIRVRKQLLAVAESVLLAL